jgi:cytochrome c oxidase subunit 2
MNWLLFASDTHPQPSTESYWYPVQLSDVAEKVDGHFMFLVWLCIFFFVGITGLLAYFVVKYRRRTPDQKPLPSPSHHNLMEITWSVIPTIVVIGLFYVGLVVYQELMIPPRETFKVSVTGQRWYWSFKYLQTGLDDANELHIPANTPIELTMTSTDLLHSFYIPALRTKKDVVPGRYSKVWFQARSFSNKVEEYNIFCAEYCGTSHSEMFAKLYVHPTMESFQEWVKKKEIEIDNKNPVELGEWVWRTKGCRGCHSIDGSAGTGPTFKGLWGDRNHRALRPATGSMEGPFVVDENYIRESINEPNALVRETFAAPSAMPSFKGRLSEKQMTGIIEFLKADAKLPPKSASSGTTPPKTAP